MRKLKQLSATALAAISMAATLVTPAFAETPETPETSTTWEITNDSVDKTAETKVTYTQESTFTVVIPKAIVLDGTAKSAGYTISVYGDISGNENVTVTPSEKFNLKDAHGKTDVEASVEQEKTAFTADEVNAKAPDENSKDGANTTGSISAASLTAGDWSGTFNFDIALNENSASSTN